MFAHGASGFSAEDVLRFLGRKLTGQLACEVTGSARRRPEGWRVKHTMARNSIKCYDKANVLRVEVTINDPTQFRVLRIKNGHRVWCPMRKEVVNLHRYFEVGRAANERYLEALAAATDNTDAMRVLDRHCRPIRNRGRQHPRLNRVTPYGQRVMSAAIAVHDQSFPAASTSSVFILPSGPGARLPPRSLSGPPATAGPCCETRSSSNRPRCDRDLPPAVWHGQPRPPMR